jgi:subtilisin family serine protease
MRKAGFSNYGEFTDIYAPGVHIYSAKPNGGFEFLDGTSMASPIVAGAVGLLKSKKLSLTNQQIVELIKKTSKKVNNMKIINVQSLLE